MATIVVSMSGGKDSAATALLALEQPDASVRIVFADTGHEHPETVAYVREYLPGALGVAVEEVRADFTERIAGKRRYVEEHWPRKGVPAADVARALAVLYPTGNPFLDLCLWKGRFPSRMAQFCTQELKRYPLDAYMLEQLAAGQAVESWRGVRRQESVNRRNAAARELTPEGWTIVQPIVDWTADQVVAYVQSKGVKLNPLYRQGMGRVGCMPCINVGKDELLEIARRFPEEVARVREWERLVSLASKRGATTFFTDAARLVPTGTLRQVQDDDGEWRVEAETRPETTPELVARLNIDSRIEWAKTSRGGTQYHMLRMVDADEPQACSSLYGLCE